MNQKYRSNEHKISTNEHKNFKITKNSSNLLNNS